MPSSGSGVGFPISVAPAPPSVVSLLSQPLPYNILSLSKFAKILGINPAHFWGATAPNLTPMVFPASNQCSHIWTHYAWQNPQAVSRYDLAQEINNAEYEIAKVLGYWFAPIWIVEEKRQYPRDFAREYFASGLDIRAMEKSVDAAWGRIIETGRRAVSLVGYANVAGGSLTYSDEDADGFYETATISVPTSLTDICELRVYHTGYLGDQEWEIREPRRKYISGGVAVFVYDSWLFINPELWEAMPTENGFSAVDISTVSNFVTTVDVYREYADPTQAAAEFYWENSQVACACGGSGCAICADISQEGCVRIRDGEAGILVPIPATYDDVWEYTTWSCGREPDKVTLYYRAGQQSNRNQLGRTCDELTMALARAIAYLAVARLERPLCACNNVEALVENLRTDMAKNPRDFSFFVTPELMHNPFGTRVGEVQAWRTIAKIYPHRFNVAVI